MNLLYGTENPAKFSFMKRQLAFLPFGLLSLSDMTAPPPPIEEAGNTPLENARIKATAYYHAYHIPVFSCDSGLYFDEVPAEWQPGVHVRRVGGKTLSDAEMTAYYAALAGRFGVFSKSFQDSSPACRGLTAQYRNAIYLVMDDTHRYERMDQSIAEKKFLLTDTPHPKREKGFPLDCLSVDPESGRYYYDLSNHATDEIASGTDRMSRAYARFFSEALEDFRRRTEK